MKQFSLFDLPADPEYKRDDGPSFWWSLKYKSIYDQVVADFVTMYEVEPIFHLTWVNHQVFLTHPARAVVMESGTGLLADLGRRCFWNKDYRKIKAFRPQDLAPQIKDVLSGALDPIQWQPMVMAEARIPDTKVEAFSERLASLHIFEQHWPAYRDAHAFRLFGEPQLLESLIYETLIGPSPVSRRP